MRTVLVLLILLAVLPAGVSAGSFVIDTSGISASEGETVLVPVSVTGADALSGYQLLINTGNTASAEILVDAASAKEMTYSDETGILIWAGALRDEMIEGDACVFFLSVTPKTQAPVPLRITVTQTFTGLAPPKQTANYAGYEAVLHPGENTGGGKELFAHNPAPQDKQPYPETPGKTPMQTPSPPESAIPYWVLILICVSGTVFGILIAKRRY